MTPENWAILVASIVGLVGAIGYTIKKVPQYISAYVQARVKEHEDELASRAYERARGAFREDFILDSLKETLEWLKAQLEQDRITAQAKHERDLQEAQANREIQRQMVAAVNSFSHHQNRQTDIIRILAQNAAKVDDRLSGIETRWMGRSGADD